MFRKFSENIAYLLIKNKVLDIESREIYVYAIEVISLNVTILIMCLVLSIFANCFMHFLGFILFFIPLRVLVGGYHCNRSESCLVASVSGYALTLWLVKYQIDIVMNPVTLTIAGICAVIILIWSPLINQNHPLEEYQIRRNKKIVYGIVAIDFVLFVIFSKYNLLIVSSEVIFIILVAVTLLMGIVKEKLKMNKVCD